MDALTLLVHPGGNHTANRTGKPSYDPMKLQKFVTFNLYLGGMAVFASLVLNFFIILAFAKRPRLITPFTIQILNFAIIELVTMLLEGPLNMASFVRPVFFTKKPFCAIYKFGAWSTMSIGLLQQMAIGVDRWLALLQPVWYRQKTINFGVKVTCGLIIYYFVLYLPLFIADYLHTVPVGQRCDIHNVYPGYQLFVRLATYYLPQFFTYISYPVLLVMIRCRQRKISATRKTDQANNAPIGTTTRKVVTEIDGLTRDGLKGVERASTKRTSQLSMWMMLVQIVCSVPLTVTYGLIQLKIELPYLHDMNSFSIMLTSVNMMVDPLIYWIFFRDLREESLRLLRCNR